MSTLDNILTKAISGKTTPTTSPQAKPTTPSATGGSLDTILSRHIQAAPLKAVTAKPSTPKASTKPSEMMSKVPEGTFDYKMPPGNKSVSPVATAPKKDVWDKYLDIFEKVTTPVVKAVKDRILKSPIEKNKEKVAMAKPILQAPQRAFTSVLLEPAAGAVSLIKGKKVQPEYTPKTKFEKMVFGEEPIKGIFKKTSESQTMIEKVLAKAGVEQDKSKGISLALAPIFVAGSIALDLSPIGGEKNTAKIIAKSKSVDEIFKVLKPIFKGRGDDEVMSIASKLVSVDDATQVKNVITEEIRQSAGKVPTVPALNVDNAVGRERGFITSVKEAYPEVKIAGQYIPRSTDDLAIKAKNLIADNIEDAIVRVNGETSDESVAIASELVKHYGDLKQYDRAAEIANSIAARLTEAGRTVQAASILGRLTPEGQLRFAAREIQKYNEGLKKFGGNLLGLKKQVPDLTPEQTKNILEESKRALAMPDGDLKARAISKVQDQIAELVPTPLYKKLIRIWKVGLLTGLKTSGVNISSNLFHGVSELIKEVPATAIDVVSSIFTGKRTMALTRKGLGGGFVEGAKKGWRYWRTGYDERNIAEKLDYKKINWGKSKVGRALQAYEQVVFGAIGAEDQPFYYGAKAHSLYSQAIALAKNAKVKGAARAEFIENLVQNPTDDMLRNAVNDAEIAVFQNKTTLGNIAKAIQKVPGGEVVVPFAQTPGAVATQLMNYTPIGAVKTILQNIGKGNFNQKTFSQGIGRAITGTAALYVGMELFKKGLIITDRPTNEREQKQWELEGKKENSIKIGDKYRSLSVLGPIGGVLGYGAQIAEGIEETGSFSKGLTQGSFGALKSVTELSFLQGLNRFSAAINDPERHATGLAGSLLGSIVPTIISDAATATDEVQRQSSVNKAGILAPLKSRIPKLRNTLQPKIDVLGQEMERAGSVLETYADPTRPSKIKSSEVIRELDRLNLTGEFATPTDFGGDKKFDILTPEQKTKLQIKAGTLLEPKLLSLFKKEDYKKKTDEDKSQLVQSLTNRARDIARAEILQELVTGLNGEALKGKMKELKASGFMTENVFKEWKGLFSAE